MRKILFVFGTRPEAIKMAPVILHMRTQASLQVKVCVTAQHRQMLDQVLNLFEIEPDYDLNLMRPGQSLSGLSSAIMSSVDEILEIEQPDLVLVHGDTTTSSVAALCCYYRQINIGHIEAGLRSGDLYSPWPEEGNRRLTAQLCRFHFAPTEINMKNLVAEGVNPNSIYVTGNTVIDALLVVINKLRDASNQLKIKLKTEIDIINNFEKMILITGHRRENFGSNFSEICMAIKHLALRYPKLLFLYPVHLNPRVKDPVNKILANIHNVRLTDPFDYEEFVVLMNHSFIILTDSGGIQEEAPALGKPVLVMRENTERPEGIQAGTSVLVGYKKDKIIAEASRLIDDPKHYVKLSRKNNPYGNGDASVKITEIINREL